MRDSSQVAYAQARIQARFGDRPTEAFWRELEAGRDFPHLIEVARGSSVGDAVESLAPSLAAHALEARLRVRWRGVCTELAHWYPPAWQPAMLWLGWLPWLPPLAWLQRTGGAPAWLAEDPVLGDLVAAEAPARADLLADGPLAPLADAWRNGADLVEAWRLHWRSTWPAGPARERGGLERLDTLLAGFTPGAAAPAGPAIDALVDAAQVAVTRVFRRLAGTPVAGIALLVLLALDHLRLRAALAVARSFGQAGTA
jgi:hypothetical protein